MEFRKRKSLVWTLLLAITVLIALAADSSSNSVQSRNNAYVVLAWNNLGMHCYNPDFKDLAVLPPFNVLWAQVYKVGDPPQAVTSGITLQYQIVDNTYSAGKTNFWTYVKQLFGVQPPVNIGLPTQSDPSGKGLSGTMDLVNDPDLGPHFEAAGIPLTEYLDGDRRLKRPYPYQLAKITVRDASGNVVARTFAVAPVSSELQCMNCHADDGDATGRLPAEIKPTGNVDTNILVLHDWLNGKYNTPEALMNNRPVLCANCHASNALGLPGTTGVKSLSAAMHNHHNPGNAPDIAPDTTAGCYNCHPGPKTQCLRDVMSQKFALNCTTCHGNMVDVAASADSGREPWAREPRCDSVSCHGAGYALDQPLYRNSRGHGGTYCAGCHDSPHAIAPSREYNDSIKFTLLQGHPGPLRKCTVCHLTQPSQAFRHARGNTPLTPPWVQ
ncbi:MAG: hypothetical protein ABFD97_08825 [Syntrophobacter sp.]